MRTHWLFHAAAIGSVAAGCGAKVTVDTGGAGGSISGAERAICDLKTAALHICVTYDFGGDTTGLAVTEEDNACKSAGGTPGSCPTANVLGTCTLTAVDTTAAETFYSDTSPPFTVSDAQMACTDGGGTFM